jgi:hypothetical protein
MIKKLVIVVCAFGLGSCATTQFPMDDTYYWPDETAQSVPSAPVVQSSQKEQKEQKTPSVEYLDVKDTSVTVRIKR